MERRSAREMRPAPSRSTVATGWTTRTRATRTVGGFEAVTSISMPSRSIRATVASGAPPSEAAARLTPARPLMRALTPSDDATSTVRSPSTTPVRLTGRSAKDSNTAGSSFAIRARSSAPSGAIRTGPSTSRAPPPGSPAERDMRAVPGAPPSASTSWSRIRSMARREPPPRASCTVAPPVISMRPTRGAWPEGPARAPATVKASAGISATGAPVRRFLRATPSSRPSASSAVPSRASTRTPRFAVSRAPSTLARASAGR